MSTLVRLSEIITTIWTNGAVAIVIIGLFSLLVGLIRLELRKY